MENLSDRFWDVIDAAKAETGANQVSASPDALRVVLERLPDADVRAFLTEFYRRLIQLNRWDIWGAGYVMSGGMGDDSFHYFRSWIIGCGRNAYEVAHAKPDDLGELAVGTEDFDNELLEYVALDVLKARGFEDDPREVVEGSADAFPEGSEWAEDELESMFPRLWAQFE